MNQQKLVLIDQRLQKKTYKSQDICFVVKKVVNSTIFKINEKVSLATVDNLIGGGQWVIDIVGK